MATRKSSTPSPAPAQPATVSAAVKPKPFKAAGAKATPAGKGTPPTEAVKPAEPTKPAKPIKAVKPAPAAKPAKSAKPAQATLATPAPKAAKPVKPTKEDKVAKEDKPRKPKLVRDSFTIPKNEYEVIDQLKTRAARLGRPTKKSELLRAGINLLAGLSDSSFSAALADVPALKTGRPSKG